LGVGKPTARTARARIKPINVGKWMIVGVEEFDRAAVGLIPGRTVRVSAISHEPWGVRVTILDWVDVDASIDAAMIDSPSGSGRALPEEYPSIGAELDAVVQSIRRYTSPGWIRLTIRAADLEEFRWPCGFCGEPTVLNSGGDGVVLDVRTVDGPESTSFAAHRACLSERVHPSIAGERARIASLGDPARRGKAGGPGRGG
jgi:hypothetical protein